jgi:diacylglycerol kinase (ATP)
MRTCVIVNPKAGSAGDLGALEDAVERMPDAALVLTDGPGAAERLAREAADAGAELVVAAGGDGTLNEVLNGLAGHFGRVRLGLLPLGTGNDFARTVGVPAELTGALAVLAAGRVRRLDVGRARGAAGERYFLNMSAGGFSGMVNEKMDEDMKSRWGPLSYLRSAVEALPELAPFHAVLTLDGCERLAVETYSVVVSNGRFVASGIPVAPQSRVDDGLLDLMIAPVASFGRLAVLVPQVLLGRHVESDLLLFRRAARVGIGSDPAMTFNVDGEPIGETPLELEVLPRVLDMVVGEIEEPVEASASLARADAGAPPAKS